MYLYGTALDILTPAVGLSVLTLKIFHTTRVSLHQPLVAICYSGILT